MRDSWTVRKANQSILKEISPEYYGRTDAEAEGPIFWPPGGTKSESLKKTLMLGKIESRREWHNRECDGEIASLTQWT